MRNAKINLLFNVIVCFVLCFICTLCSIKNNSANNDAKTHSEEVVEIRQVENTQPIIEEVKEPEYFYNSKNWTERDKYLLAKIAMAEAEGCPFETKCSVVATVLNRLESSRYPNTIEGVIFQKLNGVYQFSPIGDGRWNKVEPNEDCWKAVEFVMAAENDFSNGALFFESCINENNWHSQNLTFLYKIDNMRFYK